MKRKVIELLNTYQTSYKVVYEINLPEGITLQVSKYTRDGYDCIILSETSGYNGGGWFSSVLIREDETGQLLWGDFSVTTSIVEKVVDGETYTREVTNKTEWFPVELNPYMVDNILHPIIKLILTSEEQLNP